MKHEKGFYYLEFPAKSGKADSLVVILHGHNNHPKMFDKLPEEIHAQHPGADVIIVQAPIPLNAPQENKDRKGIPDVDDLYTWHKLDRNVRSHAGLVIANFFNRIGVIGRLNKFIDHQLEERGLEDKNLAIFGFSMGGAIAVEVGTKRKGACAAVVNHSGMVLPNLKARSKPATLMVMGDQDQLFYTRRLTLPEPKKGKLKKAFHKVARRIGLHYDDSVKRLKGAGLDVTERIVPDLQHTISRESFDVSVEFIKKRLGK